MSSSKVAVVTGSNKGIGYAVVKGLCERFYGCVYLTSRDEKRGKAAVTKLNTLGYKPLYHQLDVTDQKSIDNFRDYLQSKHGGIDVLVNNAAIVFESTSKKSNSEMAKEIIRVNYYGILKVSEALFPLLRQDGRVVNVTSSAGHLSNIRSSEIKAKLINPDITVEELNTLMDTYVKDATEGKEERWAILYGPYAVSKVGVSCLTKIHQKLFDAETPNRNIAVNSIHPGYIDTDLTSEMTKIVPGAGTIEEGAKPILFLVLEADYKGQYVWKNCSVINWNAPALPEPY